MVFFSVEYQYHFPPDTALWFNISAAVTPLSLLPKSTYGIVEVLSDGVSEGSDGVVEDEQVLGLVSVEGGDEGA